MSTLGWSAESSGVNVGCDCDLQETLILQAADHHEHPSDVTILEDKEPAAV